MRIKIVSDGTSSGTRVIDELGNQIQGISKIEIYPIEPGQMVIARLEFESVELNISAQSE